MTSSRATISSLKSTSTASPRVARRRCPRTSSGPVRVGRGRRGTGGQPQAYVPGLLVHLDRARLKVVQGRRMLEVHRSRSRAPALVGTTPLFDETNTHIGENNTRAFSRNPAHPRTKISRSTEPCADGKRYFLSFERANIRPLVVPHRHTLWWVGERPEAAEHFFNLFKEITYLGAQLRPKSASRAGRS